MACQWKHNGEPNDGWASWGGPSQSMAHMKTNISLNTKWTALPLIRWWWCSGSEGEIYLRSLNGWRLRIPWWPTLTVTLTLTLTLSSHPNLNPHPNPNLKHNPNLNPISNRNPNPSCVKSTEFILTQTSVSNGYFYFVCVHVCVCGPKCVCICVLMGVVYVLECVHFCNSVYFSVCVCVSECVC